MHHPSDSAAPHTCPKCHSTEIERVPRHRLLDRMVVAVLPWGVYRCRDCGARFYDRRAQRRAS